MKKVAILGVENSHAWGFSKTLCPKEGEKIYPDVELIGCYADLEAEDGRIGKENIMKQSACTTFASSFDGFVNQADAAMCTSRHGKNHMPLLRPYIEKGLPVWVDKPISTSTKDALELVRLVKEHHVPICGGSCLKFSNEIKKMAELVRQNPDKVTGGHVTAPVDMTNPYGNFWFYSQHLVQMMLSVFGYDVKSVSAERGENFVRAVYYYDHYEVTAYYGAGYTTTVYLGNYDAKSMDVTLDGCFDAELKEFCDMLETGKGITNYKEFLTPVYVLEATEKAFEEGKKTDIAVPDI